VASGKSRSKRRTARRVLSDALSMSSSKIKTDFSWIEEIYSLDTVRIVLPDVVAHLAQATKFERGAILRHVMKSLYELFDFALSRGINATGRFVDVLIDLASKRAGAMIDIFAGSELHEIALDLLHAEFTKYLATNHTVPKDRKECVLMNVSPKNECEVKSVSIPLPLFRAMCSFLYAWDDSKTVCTAEGEIHLSEIIDYLLPLANEKGVPAGLAGSKLDTLSDDAFQLDLVRIKCAILGTKRSLGSLLTRFYS